MNRIDFRLVLGGLLILAGIVFLLENLGVVALGGLFWGAFLLVCGAGFTTVTLTRPGQWWALIPGVFLLALSGLVFLDFWLPALADRYGGAITLGGLGLAFFAVYLADRLHWWALIPGGILASLAAVDLAPQIESLRRLDSAVILFAGFGLTFLLVFVLPTRGERNTWAIFPALGMLLVSVLIFGSAAALLNIIWPLLIIGLGLVLIGRSLLGRGRA
jgi:hypothetical protein